MSQRERTKLLKQEEKKAFKGRKINMEARREEGLVSRGDCENEGGASFCCAMNRGSQVYCSANHINSCLPYGF